MAVVKAKNHEEWKVGYMTLLMRDQEMIRKDRVEGRAEDIRTMLKKGRTPEEIADFCGYDLDEIRTVQESSPMLV